MSKLTKYTGGQMAKANGGAVQAHGAHKGITLKQVMILDTGDGAFIDASVKVKPHKTNPNQLVLKCTDQKRLVEAAKRMGLTLIGMPQRGSKHWIAFVWKQGFGDALALQGQQAGGMLGAPTAKAVPVGYAHAKQLVAKKGGAQ